jgi:hypothetical protein
MRDTSETMNMMTKKTPTQKKTKRKKNFGGRGTGGEEKE